MKVSKKLTGGYRIALTNEELGYLSAVLEDHATDLAVKWGDKFTESGYEEVADRIWAWSCDMDRALGMNIAHADPDAATELTRHDQDHSHYKEGR